MALEVRDMRPEDEYFVGTCTHEREDDEHDRSARRRIAWLRSREADGLRVKVALRDGRRVGFLYAMPIEVCPEGPLGEDLLVFPCLFVLNEEKGRGVGQALLDAAEEEAQRQGLNGTVTTGYNWHDDFWFMPASFFERKGYRVVETGKLISVMWKPLRPDAKPPTMLRPDYRYEPVPGRVGVDLFRGGFCMTGDIEAERVREVAAEFGERVVLREHSADDRDAFLRHQIPRAIYVNGKEIGWGYEAPKEGVREAIRKALGEAE